MRHRLLIALALPLPLLTLGACNDPADVPDALIDEVCAQGVLNVAAEGDAKARLEEGADQCRRILTRMRDADPAATHAFAHCTVEARGKATKTTMELEVFGCVPMHLRPRAQKALEESTAIVRRIDDDEAAAAAEEARALAAQSSDGATR